MKCWLSCTISYYIGNSLTKRAPNWWYRQICWSKKAPVTIAKKNYHQISINEQKSQFTQLFFCNKMSQLRRSPQKSSTLRFKLQVGLAGLIPFHWLSRIQLYPLSIEDGAQLAGQDGVRGLCTSPNLGILWRPNMDFKAVT